MTESSFPDPELRRRLQEVASKRFADSEALKRAQELVAGEARRSLKSSPSLDQLVDLAKVYESFVDRNPDTILNIQRTITAAQAAIDDLVRNNPEFIRTLTRVAELQAQMARPDSGENTAPEETQEPPESEEIATAAAVATQLLEDPTFDKVLESVPTPDQQNAESVFVDLDPRLARILLALIAARQAAALAFDHPELKALFDNVIFIIEVALFMYQMTDKRDPGDSP